VLRPVAAALLAAATAWRPVAFLFVCGSASGHIDGRLWVAGGVLAFATGHPSRGVVVIVLAVAVNGNTGLCPD
jgi:hypothetical protein